MENEVHPGSLDLSIYSTTELDAIIKMLQHVATESEQRRFAVAVWPGNKAEPTLQILPENDALARFN